MFVSHVFNTQDQSVEEYQCRKEERQAQNIPSPTSFRCLKLLGEAGGALSLSVINSDIERVEAEGVQPGQHAMGVVPTEGQDLLIRVMGVVFVQIAFFPVVHLQDKVYSESLSMY